MSKYTNSSPTIPEYEACFYEQLHELLDAVASDPRNRGEFDRHLVLDEVADICEFAEKLAAVGPQPAPIVMFHDLALALAAHYGFSAGNVKTWRELKSFFRGRVPRATLYDDVRAAYLGAVSSMSDSEFQSLG